MIKLDVEEFCQSCEGFKAESNTTFLYADGMAVETIVTCKYIEKCRDLKRYIERELHKEKVLGDKKND